MSHKKGGTADLFALFMRDHGKGVYYFKELSINKRGGHCEKINPKKETRT